jgi:hypothetical protein
MRKVAFWAAAATVALAAGVGASAGGNSSADRKPGWWTRFEALLEQPAVPAATAVHAPKSFGTNVDVSNEDGPQSETSIALDPNNPDVLVAASNDVNRLPERAYFSSDRGAHWGAVDAPLPPPLTTDGTDFATDPGVAFDTQGHVYLGYLIVFFSRDFRRITGSEMAVARSSDGGQSWPQVTYFNFTEGDRNFNDKPMIAVDSNPASPYRDTVYLAWDIDSGRAEPINKVLLSRSTDGGLTFSTPLDVSSEPSTKKRGDNHSVFGPSPFIGPNGEVYVGWQDVLTSQVKFNHSSDGGATFGQPVTIAPTVLAVFEYIPAQASRSVSVYPACDADRSNRRFHGTLYCSWTDETAQNGMDVFVSRSTDNGATWSAPFRVNDDQAGVRQDQFNQWLTVDPVTGAVDVSWHDTRNDPANVQTDVYFGQSTDGGQSFKKNLRATTAMSDESTANPDADQRDQYGDYDGITAYGGVVHPVWTDGRLDGAIDPGTGQTIGEETFTATLNG